METLVQVLLLLGVAVPAVIVFQRLRIPTSLAYLLVGLILGPYTMGPVVDLPQIKALAEFGIVFLLFTIGLNFSVPELHSQRSRILLLGTGQIVFTTAAVGAAAWLAGLPPPAAFVTGAVFAQSSTTLIGKQLIEQGEENSRHGRLGLTMSVFQDVTAVPFLVVIPVLGTAAGAEVLAASLAWAMAKAAGAFALVFAGGRWALRPLLHMVAGRRSSELFTLTVLFVALLAAWTTHSLGLSLAFGAFLAGMMLSETEYRHQIESSIRPFRDVLLGLFFVDIGMLFDPSELPGIWHWALAGAVFLLASKTLLVAAMVRAAKADGLTAWRTGLLLAVGGEFGLALLAIALGAQVIGTHAGQIVLTAVLFSMAAGPFIIRYNHAIAELLTRGAPQEDGGNEALAPGLAHASKSSDHVIICGYGRIGQCVARFLAEESIPFVALDLDPARVREAHAAGEPVFYGDAAKQDLLEAVGLGRARLLVITHDDLPSALAVLDHVRAARPGLPVMARTRDESHVAELQAAGAMEVVPETLEAGVMIAAQALLLTGVPVSRVMKRIQDQRSGHFRLMRQYFRGGEAADEVEEADVCGLRSITVPPGSPAIGRPLSELGVNGVSVTALVRSGQRKPAPSPGTRVEMHDVIVAYGPLESLLRLEERVLG
ncbi:MAG TPA: cation:proton antiporter [Methylocella sp.]|nr:cation:proton antiporter [Methylocella sp.]